MHNPLMPHSKPGHQLPSRFDDVVRRLVEFGGTKIRVMSIPLLILEGNVKFDRFLEDFFGCFQLHSRQDVEQNEVDIRFDTHPRPTVRYSIVDGLDDQSMQWRKNFIQDWKDKLLTDVSIKRKLPMEQYAIKIQLPNGTMGYILPIDGDIFSLNVDSGLTAVFEFWPTIAAKQLQPTTP